MKSEVSNIRIGLCTVDDAALTNWNAPGVRLSVRGGN
jgi:hypothetical protein